MNYHINIFFSEEDGGYIADIPDLKLCPAFGYTPEEALTEVEKARRGWRSLDRPIDQSRRRDTTHTSNRPVGSEQIQSWIPGVSPWR